MFLAAGVHATMLAGTPFAHGRLDGLTNDLPSLLPAVIRDRRADSVVLVDLTSMLMTCALRGIDPRFLGRLPVPVIGLDLLSVGETSLVLDPIGGDIVLPRAGLELVPRRIVAVPVARPDAPGACNFWPAGDAVTVDHSVEKTGALVLATAFWQTHSLAATPSMHHVPGLLVPVLARTGREVIHVGPAPFPGHERLPRYRHVRQLPARQFCHLVAGASVFVTLNQLSSAAAVALDLGVPCVAVVGRAPPFRAWPAGFQRFFGEVLDRNPIGALVRSVCVEDGDELADALLAPRLDRPALAAYRAAIAALPRAADKMKEWTGTRPSG
jgi:hypothetical protein